MKDAEQVCTYFASVIDNNRKSVAVYGLKEYAQLIGSQFSDNVSAYLDRDRCDGLFLGKPIVSISKLDELNIDTIIIAASLEAEEKVYERIHQECEQKKVAVYGIHSGDLRKGCVGKKILSTNIDGAERQKELWKEISRHEVISFDIFDTLLMRRVLYPSDIFEITGYRAKQQGIAIPDNFKDYRQQAEILAAKEHGGIDGIYIELKKMLSMPESDINKIKKIELQVESDALLPRTDMLETFQYAKDNGKILIAVSDMYLPPEFLSSLLSKLGYAGWDSIYVSDAKKVNKHDGLFKFVRKDYPKNSILHIGDNERADGWPARVLGMDVFPIKSGLAMFRETEANQPFKYIDNINERLLVGMFVNRAYGSPFAYYEKNAVPSPSQFTDLFISPIIVSFIIWVVQKLDGRNYEAALFAARDGYLLVKMYKAAINILKDAKIPPGEYFYTSRRVCVGACLQNECDLYWLYNQYRYKIKALLEASLGIQFDLDNKQATEDVMGVQLWQFLLKKKNDIFKQARSLKENYIKYMSKCHLKKNGNYVLIDLDSRGTTQRALRHAFWPDLPTLYFHRWISEETPSTGEMKSFLPLSYDYSKGSYIIEFILSSPEPSVIGLNDEGDIVLDKECRSKQEIDVMYECQSVIMQYLEEYLKLFVQEKHLSRYTGQQLLELYAHKSMRGAEKSFLSYSISNDFFGEQIKNLEPEMTF